MTERVKLLPEEPQATAVTRAEKTHWHRTEAPPCSGFWEVLVDEEPNLTTMVSWFDQTAFVWIVGGKAFTMQDFRNGELAWRGLRKPATAYAYRVPQEQVVRRILITD